MDSVLQKPAPPPRLAAMGPPPVWAALLPALLGLAPIRSAAEGKTPPAQFLMQGTAECRFGRGSPPRRVRFLAHYFYNQQEILHFDSDLGAFLAVLELGLPEARSWNSRKDLLEMYQAEVDLFCRKNHEAVRAIVRQVQPTVTISPSRNDPLSPRTLLLCTAAGFYPPEIEVRWLKNGRRATEGVFYGEVLQNGDWTYQTQMMLEDTPQRGDVYACQVEHASLETPIAVQWEPWTSASARRKIWTGVTVALLGLLFGVLGLYHYLKSKNGDGKGSSFCRGSREL
ncbi:H-2 class II histocompatibility antigen, E-S beta chain-like [Varanus komodoensis]|uniref:H-2 class II histocompatibility antigen, E-S beta chain-like n=1 Tax=Varanus komodoensis TaxID=61221 RepID=UPI001CF7C662|nr:H-2 class II histocompatibility antigen, E-S beta chain-like [Varanus komodoensis]